MAGGATVWRPVVMRTIIDGHETTHWGARVVTVNIYGKCKIDKS